MALSLEDMICASKGFKLKGVAREETVVQDRLVHHPSGRDHCCRRSSPAESEKNESAFSIPNLRSEGLESHQVFFFARQEVEKRKQQRDITL